MSDNQPEHQILNETELKAAREEIEFLHELIKSQKFIIDDLEKELVKDSQKLELKIEELNRFLISGVCFDEAKAIAKQLLKDEKNSSVLVAKLLSIIYNVPLEAIKIQGTLELGLESNQVIAQLKEVKQNFQKMHDKYIELGCQFFAFRIIFNEIKEQLNTLPPPPEKN
ncbi:hypothetical protein NIES2101_17560 [Calothrix sp. HK-06]|nr:hypothetical protein NIES2101_17560 [Calothrix sp. HK-06]